MDNASVSRKPPKMSELGVDEIPEAVRDTPHAEIQAPPSVKKGFLWSFAGLAVIAAMGAGAWWQLQSGESVLSTTAGSNPESAAAISSSPVPTPASSASPTAPQSPLEEKAPENLLGHLPYEEAPAGELQSITNDGSIKLRKTAATKYQEMVKAAASEGIYLIPISGFRSVDEQQHVFFDIKAERGQNAPKRAEVSAPPGYSEHHTGYAIDIGDANAPETNLNTSFENTLAFKWLQANAAYFSFEISFPKDNSQGVNYEPWHWRYVGDRHSLETFYKAHSLKKQ